MYYFLIVLQISSVAYDATFSVTLPKVNKVTKLFTTYTTCALRYFF